MASPGPIYSELLSGKPPWRPKVAGYVAFLLGPIAGALVAAVSLRRMGLPQKGRSTISYALLLCFAFLIPFFWFIPPDAPIKKLIILAVEGAGFSVFPSILREDFQRWKFAHPGLKPANDWGAAGWGILGALMYLGCAAIVAAFSP